MNKCPSEQVSVEKSSLQVLLNIISKSIVSKALE